MLTQIPSSSDSEKNFVTPDHVPTYFTNETVVEEARINREQQPAEKPQPPPGECCEE